ncbi:hypothetical protein BG015_011849 [Linnemannia schmuckeri]|uniref:Autophagy-related protein 14 n=1 Tax=Linnemannia schmuckeri TaxID=64567 RepID=A0A9P5VE91_9FUNG|nr:hypothetical protein BG015_011849 [Linnemannia schmuckeri]
MEKGRMKHRQGLEPTQRRVRHIQTIQARNLTFSPNANQRTLASALLVHPTPQYPQQGNNSNYNTAYSTTGSNYNYNTTGSTYSYNPYQQQLQHQNTSRSITPSLELRSGTSSPTKSSSYFRSPWKSYSQGVQKIRGPGSDTGSVSAASESGRTGGASSAIKEPIARLSAGLKATVFSAGTSYESSSGYASESGSGSVSGQLGGGAGNIGGALKAKSKGRVSADFSNQQRQRHLQTQTRYQQQQQHQLEEGEYSRSFNDSFPAPSQLTARDPQPSPNQDITPRNSKDAREDSNSSTPSTVTDADSDLNNRLPAFLSGSKRKSGPILLNSYFTLHDPDNDEVIYTSDTVTSSNNPKYSPLEEHGFLDPSKRRIGSIVIRIWAGYRDSDYFLLLEWKVELCCLRYIGKELRDLPSGLPNNMILFGFESGYYTAADEDELMDHPHMHSLEPVATIPGGGVSRSYTYETVMRLNNLHECIMDTKKSRDEIKHSIESAMNKENAPMILQRRRGEYTERLWHLQRQVGHELNVLEEAQDRAEALRREHAARRKALDDSRERGQTQEMYLEENIINLTKNKESLFHVLKEYSSKRTELIATLFTIFPITQSENDPNLLMICKVPLPNSVYNGMDEDLVSIALGFTCQLVVMLAHYLNVPLRYPLTPMGSRAFVIDPVSLLVGPKEFPLYGKGQDRNRFEYGVFLLNKDIEQLMNSQGLQFMDLRQTLPNIRYLMETLLTKSPIQSMLYRSKFTNRRKHERLDQDRLENLFTISTEQRELDHILNSRSHSSMEGGKDQGSSSSGIRSNDKGGALKNNSGDHSLLQREYDPIDGGYTLILDSASTMSQRSRKETVGSDISTIERSEPCSTPMSPRGARQRKPSGLQHGYSSSLELSSSSDDEGGSHNTDEPGFSGWAFEAAAEAEEQPPLLPKRPSVVVASPTTTSSPTSPIERQRQLSFGSVIRQPIGVKARSVERIQKFVQDTSSRQSPEQPGNADEPNIIGVPPHSPRRASSTSSTTSATTTTTTSTIKPSNLAKLSVATGVLGRDLGNKNDNKDADVVGPLSASHSPPPRTVASAAISPKDVIDWSGQSRKRISSGSSLSQQQQQQQQRLVKDPVSESSDHTLFGSGPVSGTTESLVLEEKSSSEHPSPGLSQMHSNVRRRSSNKIGIDSSTSTSRSSDSEIGGGGGDANLEIVGARPTLSKDLLDKKHEHEPLSSTPTVVTSPKALESST